MVKNMNTFLYTIHMNTERAYSILDARPGLTSAQLKKKYYKKASSSFSYHVQIPGHIDEKKDPDARFKDGVLKISFSKIMEQHPRKINIR